MEVFLVFVLLLLVLAALQTLGWCDFRPSSKVNAPNPITANASPGVSVVSRDADWSKYDQPAFLRKGIAMPEHTPTRLREAATACSDSRKCETEQQAAMSMPSIPAKGFGSFELIA